MTLDSIRNQYVKNARRANHRAIDAERTGYQALAKDSRYFRDWWMQIARRQ